MELKIPSGWWRAGSQPTEYEMGVDPTTPTVPPQATLRFTNGEGSGFGTMMQGFSAGKYANKRIRLSAEVNAENVSGWVGLWLRTDSGNRSLALDNMHDRPLTGTCDWTLCSNVLHVPAECDHIALGLLLHGKGEASMRNLMLEVVSDDTPTTEVHREPDGPANFEFAVSECASQG